MRRIPLATYRLQLHRNFTLRDARAVVPYLSRLGISDLYCSPILRAREGSTHGYDVIDANVINPELGGEEAFLELQETLREHDMGFLLDIVPNHMAAVPENAWWMSVLENGPHSRYINYFDIEWRPLLAGAKLENKVLLPVLGKPYGESLESGEISLQFSSDGFFLHYYEKRFPVAPHTYATILQPIVDELPSEHLLRGDLEGLVAAPRAPVVAAGDAAMNINSRFLKETLWRLHEKHGEFRDLLEKRLSAMNGKAGNAASFDELDRLANGQWYRLSYWRAASEEINYRRFFDVSDLVGVRVEAPEVFEARHAKLFELADRGFITGLRIDHIDGLYEPISHLRRLQRRFGGDESTEEEKNFYVIVEKILGPDEVLRESFRCDGTTGYESLIRLNDLFVDPQGARELEELWKRIAPEQSDYEQVVRTAKRQVIDELFSGEIRGLAMKLLDIAASDRSARDFSFSEILEALTTITVELDVYRTYIRSDGVADEDRMRIERAIERARSVGRVEPRLYEFLRNVLLVTPPHYVEDKNAWREFTMKWQQFSGRVMAKGVEDTAFYRFHRLLSRNDVGGEPNLPLEESVDRFHDHNTNLATSWPHSLNTTSTHDTKRSEDVRARINALSEYASDYVRLFKATSKKVQSVSDPDLHLILQSLIGVWPVEDRELGSLPQRLDEYFAKAAREGKLQSSWLQPNEEYERLLKTTARELISNESFQKEFVRLQKKVALVGMINSLAQTLLKTASPGVPDFYQGTELWDLSLVDPDNRRPVDYETRMSHIERGKRPGEVRAAVLPRLLREWKSGVVKLDLIRQVLQIRKRFQPIFEAGGYEPARAAGSRAASVLAFSRSSSDGVIVAVVPRLVGKAVGRGALPVGAFWEDTVLSLPESARWRNLVTEEMVETGAVSAILRVFPVALLADEKALETFA